MQSLLLLRQRHSTHYLQIHMTIPSLIEALFTNSLNFLNTLHSLESSSHQITVILHRAIASLFKFKCRVLEIKRLRNGKFPTTRISFPLARLKAFVQRTFLGLRRRLKFLRHFDLQNLKTYIQSSDCIITLPCYRYAQRQCHDQDRWVQNRNNKSQFSFLQVTNEIEPRQRK